MSPPRALYIWGPLITLWLVWGSTYMGISVVLDTMPGLLTNGFRFLLATAVLGSILVVTQGFSIFRISLPQFAYASLMGVMLLGVGIGTLSFAQQYVPSGIAALLVAVIPLWIVILRIAAKDRPSRLTLVGVVVGLIGLALMLLPGGTTPISGTDRDVVLGSLAILLSAFSWAYFSFRSPSFNLPRNAAVTAFYELFAAGMALLAAGAITGQRFTPAEYSTTSWLGFGYLVIASIVGFTAYSWLLARAPMSLVSTYAYVNPVVAVFLGWLILREAITTDVIIGLTVIVGGVVLVVNGERTKRL